MDIEKLIEQLRKSADFEDYPIVASFAAIIEKKYLRDAATALSTLQAENEKLRAELEQVISERDAAVERLREWEKFDIYLLAHNFLIPEKWRGIQKED